MGYKGWADLGDNTFIPSGDFVTSLPRGIYNLSFGFKMYMTRIELAGYDGVVIHTKTSTSLLQEMMAFFANAEKYKRYGLIHKRGFLLHGRPGAGKTKTCISIVQQFVELGGLAIFVQDINLGMALSTIRQIEAQRPILLVIEDIDQHLRSDEPAVLNLLDGVDSVNGMLVLATTNYLEKLPERIRNRPSRFDRVIELTSPEPEVREHYLKTVSNNTLTPDEIAEWVSATEGFSIAHLKELFVSVKVYDGDLQGEVKRLRDMEADFADKDEDDDDDDHEVDCLCGDCP